MRRALRELPGRPDHAGLAYDVWARFGDDGKAGDDAARSRWLDGVAAVPAPADYGRFYAHVRQSLVAERARAVEGTLVSRLIVGHGNPSPVDVGLTMHHTWGVPVIPGSALKGLLSQYIEAVYGPAPADEPAPDAEERARWAAPRWQRQARADGRRGNRLVGAPGDCHRALFGAPPVPADPDENRRHASQGRVVFHDAVFVPDSLPAEADGRPYTRDVLTVHHRRWYGQGEGARGAERGWPDDHDAPGPVPFLTVRPGARFLIALGGDAAWADFALRHLQHALCDWGIGGKTVAGYGRFSTEWRRAYSPEDAVVADSAVQPFLDWLAAHKDAGTAQRQVWRALEAEWRDRLLALADPVEREAAGRAIGGLLGKHPKLKAAVAALREALEP